MEEPEIIIEQREECMISRILLKDRKPTARKAHFLKPSVTSIDGSTIKLPAPHVSSKSESKKPPLKVDFSGWRNPLKNWKVWVDRLNSKHQSTWKRAGIHEAILSSTYIIPRSDELIFGIAEKWCSETNTFLFPWGETTITLEDMMIMGGYSVLGDSVLTPLETEELEEIENRLNQTRLEIGRTKAKKAVHQIWMRIFMEEEEEEEELEHEAFLSLWLSRFVFPKLPKDTVVKDVFPIAIHLSKGKKLALAPAVLASIYSELTLLKSKMAALSELGEGIGKEKEKISQLRLWAPFQLVQVWALERFMNLRPHSNVIDYNEPRIALLHNMKKLRLKELKIILEDAPECFQWRPYTRSAKYWLFPKFYSENEIWVLPDSDLDIEIESFFRCLRSCELVGIDGIEQYLPHRVANQFGMDQDIPGLVARCNESPEIAWKNYCKPISRTNLYIPPRYFDADVTTRYLNWWKQSVLGQQFLVKNEVESSEKVQQSLEIMKGSNDPGVPPGFSQKSTGAKALDSSEEDGPTVAQAISSKRIREMSKEKKEENYPSVPPGFPAKSKSNEAATSSGDDKLTVEETVKFSQKTDNVGNSDSGKNLTDVQSKNLSSPAADNEIIENVDSLMEQGEEKRAVNDTDKSEVTDADKNAVSSHNNEEENNGNEARGLPGLQLETRVSKLENMVTGLKRKHA